MPVLTRVLFAEDLAPPAPPPPIDPHAIIALSRELEAQGRVGLVGKPSRLPYAGPRVSRPRL